LPDDNPYEAEGRLGPRQIQLRRLHHHTTNDFVTATGFGADRMTGLYVRDYHLELAPAEPVRLTSAEYQPETADAPPAADAALPPRPQVQELEKLHGNGFWDFLDPDRIGYVRDRDHVAGFVPHRFTQVPKLGNHESENKDWRVTRLELVSLLRHETPVAYVSPHLPRMDELIDAPTRPLEPFEIDALARLHSEEELVVDNDAQHIRMVGALRAAKDCLACHSVRSGALLGAFSYELRPAKESLKPRPPKIPRKPQA
jgi:hypothetical protein